jgi:polysaccharide biosynthesis transport protein
MNIRASDFGETADPGPPGIPVPAADPSRQVGVARDNAPAAFPYGSLCDEPRSSFDLLKYWGLFLKHRWLFLAGTMIALCLGYGITFLTPAIYRASTTIQIDREGEKIFDLHDNDARMSMISELQFYETEYELLKSRSLAERVVADLDLANQAGFLHSDAVSPWTKLRQIIFGGRTQEAPDLDVRKREAIARVKGGLSVKPIKDSALVILSFDDPSPSWASKIVDAFSDAFIKTNLERRYNATAYARNFLQDQLAQIKLKLEQSERGLVAYAQKEQIVNLDDKQPPLAAADLLAINSELARVRAERIQNEQLWHQAETTTGLGLPQILADQSIQMLRDKRAGLETDYQDKIKTFKPDFPDMQKLRAEINEIDRQIAAAVAIIKQSIEARYDASQQQEALLVKQLASNTSQVLDVQSRNIKYTILQREVDTNRTLYAALLQRYKDVGVGSGVGTNNISVVDAAQVPGAKFSPSLSKNLGVALVLGLLGSALAVYVLELLDDTFKTPEEVEEGLRLAVLGLTPLLAKNMTIEEAIRDPHSNLSESFRSIRTALQFSTDSGVPKSLLVTSSRPEEGKSTTSLALARNFAQLSLKVLLIDADLRRPTLHRALGCDNSIGLSNYLVGDGSSNVFRETSTPGLIFMASGPLPPNPAELLSGPKLLSLLTLAHQKFDLIILDGPPVVGLADALLLASVAGGTLMVVGACETPKNVVKRAVNRLHFARARMLGAMLSKFDARKVGFEYGYGYGYSYSNYYYGYGKDVPKLTPSAGE